MGSKAKKSKREFVLKSSWDREGIESFLEKKAAGGWMLESINDIIWRFRKEEPKSLHFSVVYFPKASSYDPEPSEKLLMFQDLCEHTGWKLAAGDGQTQIYYNEADDATPLETEEELAVLAIHESAKRYYLPVCCFLVVLGLIQFGLFCYRLATNTMYILSNNAAILSGICSLLVLVLPVVSVLQYHRWHKHAEELIESGEEIGKRNGPPDLRVSIIGMMFIALAFTIISLVGGRSGILILAMAFVGILGITLVVLEFSKLMKKRRVSGRINRNLTYTAAIVGALLIAGLLLSVMVREVQEPNAYRMAPEVRNTNGFTEYIFHDALPLVVEDLRSTSYQGYSYEMEYTAESILCGVHRAHQIPGVDGLDEPKLAYRIIDVKLPLLYGVCRNTMEKDFAHDYGKPMSGVDWEEHIAVDGTPWGAKEAYQLEIAGGLRPRYLLYYDRRIVEIEFGNVWNLTEEQKRIVGEHFGK